MKLRKIGNSQDMTFSREMLNRAGSEERQELDSHVMRGEIKPVPAVISGITVSLIAAEAKALVSGKLASKLGEAAFNKVRCLIGAA